MCFNYDEYNAKYVNIQTEINFFLKKKQKSSIKGKKMEDYPAWRNSRFLFLSLLPKKNYHARNWRLQY